MKAKVGDFLVVKGTTVEQHDQRGVITEVRSADGSPPYVVRWLSSDHIATVYSGPLNRLLNPRRRPGAWVQPRTTTAISCEERK